MVHLDRREPQARQTGGRAGFADEAREREAGGTIAEAAQVDPGEDDLAVPLRDPLADLAQNGRGRAAARPPRTRGTTQKLQEKEQPSWIFTNARTRSRPASSFTHASAPRSSATAAGVSSERRATTWTFAGRPANAPSRFAPQPVT